jgi:hypothetical protein
MDDIRPEVGTEFLGPRRVHLQNDLFSPARMRQVLVPPVCTH